MKKVDKGKSKKEGRERDMGEKKINKEKMGLEKLVYEKEKKRMFR